MSSLTDPTSIVDYKDEEMGYAHAVDVMRAGLVESVHYAAAAITTSEGELTASLGDPDTTTFLRSSAKPFQAIPLITTGAAAAFDLTEEEIALTCASHAGTDRHVAVAASILSKIGVSESALQCGMHLPYDEVTADRVRSEEIELSPIRHNCSGKHAGMLARSVYLGQPVNEYLEVDSEVQTEIMEALAVMAGVKVEDIHIGMDGCSAPNFALPLTNAAQAYAKLADPRGLSPVLTEACRTIYSAMTSNPEMISGDGRFDTRIMQVMRGRLLSKGGAEGYQGFSIPAGAIERDSPALGVAIKIAEGGFAHRARSIVSLKILQELGLLHASELAELDEFGPYLLVNDIGREIGEVVATFNLRESGM